MPGSVPVNAGLSLHIFENNFEYYITNILFPIALFKCMVMFVTAQVRLYLKLTKFT